MHPRARPSNRIPAGLPGVCPQRCDSIGARARRSVNVISLPDDTVLSVEETDARDRAAVQVTQSHAAEMIGEMRGDLAVARSTIVGTEAPRPSGRGAPDTPG